MCPCQLLHIFPTYFNNFTNFVHLPDPPQTPSGTPPGPPGTPPGPSRTPQDPLGPGHRNLFSKNKRESGSSSWHRTRICKRCRWDEGGSLSWHRNTAPNTNSHRGNAAARRNARSGRITMVFQCFSKRPGRPPRHPRRVPGRSLGVPGGSLGSPRDAQGPSRDPQELPRDSLGGARDAQGPPRDHPWGP
jgi:hypothetical protein